MTEAEAAVAIVETRGAAESVLLMRRAEREEDPWSGHWAFPGGRCEPGDGDLVSTALRELGEECGVWLSREHLEAALGPAVARRRVGKFLVVAPFVFRVNAELPVICDAREAVEAVWVPVAMLRDPARHSLSRIYSLRPDTWFPAIDLRGAPLWGFTYHLITDWLGLNPPEADAREAGFEVARRLLDFLMAHGLKLRHGWEERDGIKVAELEGVIPVALVVAQAAAPASHIPRLNALEVRPTSVRVAGLEFEEYVIRSVAD